MLNHPITDARAWRTDTIDDRQSWYYSLAQGFFEAIDEIIGWGRQESRPKTLPRAAQESCAACVEESRSVRAALESGRGFAILRGPTGDRYSPEEMTARYWLIGQLLGTPIEQNVQGTLLYDVRDTGQDVRYGARFSVTNAESSFHTDNSFGDSIADYVGLLCIQTAKSGGVSQVVSGYSVHNELRARYPRALETLYQPLHIDRRGGARPEEAPTVQHPILSWDGSGLTYRYLRYWIESGHDKIGQPLNEAQRQALDALDEVANDPALRIEFALKPGDLFFINNRWLLHNRTAFEDHTEPQRRRHLVRLWLSAESPVLPAVRSSAEVR